jgi:hypothetical protein
LRHGRQSDPGRTSAGVRLARAAPRAYAKAGQPAAVATFAHNASEITIILILILVLIILVLIPVLVLIILILVLIVLTLILVLIILIILIRG